MGRKSDEPWDPSPIHLTAQGYKDLRDRLANLKAALPDLALEAQRTAAYGDRSENAEYKEAKSTLRRTQRQIWTIEAQLKRAEIITPRKGTAGWIGLGSAVTIISKNGTRKIYQLVGPFETDPAKGRISHQSPLGAALMNHVKGDVVKIKTANGEQEYKIMEVR